MTEIPHQTKLHKGKLRGRHGIGLNELFFYRIIMTYAFKYISYMIPLHIQAHFHAERVNSSGHKCVHLSFFFSKLNREMKKM